MSDVEGVKVNPTIEKRLAEFDEKFGSQQWIRDFLQESMESLILDEDTLIKTMYDLDKAEVPEIADFEDKKVQDYYKKLAKALLALQEVKDE